MVRKENWPLLLSRFIRSRKALPFAWGSNDCVFFAIACAEELTGEPLTAEWVDTYSTKVQAQAIMDTHGGILALISDIMGMQPHSQPKKAQRGDIVVMPLAGGMTAGVVDDTAQKVISVTESGIIRLPLSNATHVWSY